MFESLVGEQCSLGPGGAPRRGQRSPLLRAVSEEPFTILKLGGSRPISMKT